MKPILSYSIGQLRTNKKSSIFIFIAIFIASALLCALCTFAYSGWLAQEKGIREHFGDFHAYIQEPITTEQLPYITENAEVEETLMQTNWRFLALDQTTPTERPYLVYSQYDQNAWDKLAIRDRLVEGRAPEKPGEVIVSQLFLQDNPDYSIGDTLTLPSGQRVLNGTPLPSNAMATEGESFQQNGEDTVTIVGTMNYQAFTAFPCYHIYGYLDAKHLPTDQTFLVYAKLNNPKDAYTVFPAIGENLGLQAGANGSLPIAYNTPILEFHSVKAPDSLEEATISENIVFAIVSVLLTLVIFVVIIYNAFSVAAHSEIKQLGILKSVGATPKQIRGTVLMQGLLLSIVAIPLGILVGFVTVIGLGSAANAMMSEGTVIESVNISPLLLLLVIVLSLLTVLISAYLPARRLAKLSAIDAVRGNTKKTRQRRREKATRATRANRNITNELATGALSANKRAYGTTIVALCLCLTLIATSLFFARCAEVNEEKRLETKTYNLSISTYTMDDPDPALIEELRQLNGSQEQALYRDSAMSMEIDPTMYAPELTELGLNPRAAKNIEKQENGNETIYVPLIGLDDRTFAEYAAAIGANVEDFQDTSSHPAIVVNATAGNMPSAQKQYEMQNTPFLNLQEGEILPVTEEIHGVNDSAPHQDQVSVTYMTETYPDLDKNIYPYYLCTVVPMAVYDDITNNFSAQNLLSAKAVTLELLIDKEELEATQAEAESILSQYLAAEDFKTDSHLDAMRRMEEGGATMNLMLLSFAVFLAFVGVSSAFSSITGSLLSRRRQFAIIRSIGLPPKELSSMLFRESVFLALLPVAFSIPLCAIAFMILGNILDYARLGDVLAATPWHWIILGAFLIIASVILAYAIVSRRIKKDTIIDAIKDETF